jgi:hypothetical protein
MTWASQACFQVLRGWRGAADGGLLAGLHSLWGLDAHSARDTRQMATWVVFRTVVCFPALVRRWWSSDAERWVASAMGKFVEELASQRIMQREMDLIAAKGGKWGAGEDEVTVRGSTVTREVTAHYLKVRLCTESTCIRCSEQGRIIRVVVVAVFVFRRTARWTW